ncbi:MAG: TrkH family potassium uptake protein [Oscillospiraceae bacterium]|jgi:trk system potassium uptake protein TrkH|nr:TrkH family potassium uptake protein [Oscillospiraceae bacterium]
MGSERRRSGYYPRILLFIALTTAMPLLVLPFYPEDARWAPTFLIPAGSAALLGIVLSALSRMAPKGVRSEQTGSPRVWQSPLKSGSPPVLFAWCAAIVSGAAPFVLGGKLGTVRALFESASGWTTAGLAVADVGALPRVFLFHRALMQYCGGLGFIIIIAVVLQERQMMSMYNAEGHPDGFLPSLRRTSTAIFLIYTGCLALGTFAYRLFGMPVFDALCHAMSALSTAGFSTRPGGIGEFDNIPVELVTSFLMLVGASNFAWLLLIVRRRFKRAARVSEARFMFAVLAVFTVLMTLSLTLQYGKGFWDALHNAVFSCVSMLSTTGYSTENYALWPPTARVLMVVLMTLGAGTGSTAGGIKLLRAYILARAAKSNIQRRLSPSHSVRLMRYTRAQGEAPIDDHLVHDALEFIFVYAAALIVGTLLITIFERGAASPSEALFEFNSVLGTGGVTNGLTARASPATLIVEMLGMLMGRLEIFVFFLAIYSSFEKARDKIRKAQ